jgi:hypothetical protein
VLESVCVFKSSSLFNEVEYTNIWCIYFTNYFLLLDCCFCIKGTSLPFLTNFGFKSVLSDEYSYSCLLLGFIYLEDLFHSFTLSCCLFLSVRCISCKQQMVSSCFLMQLAILHHLIGELRPLIFNLHNERYEVFPVILLFFFC